MNCSPLGSSVHGISQARILEWVAIPFSRGSSRTRDQTQVSFIASSLFTDWATREALYVSCACMLSCFSCVWLFATLWTIACQAALAMGRSRQEYWSWLPCPPPGDLPNPGIKPTSPASPALQVGSLLLSHQGKPPGKPICKLLVVV